MVPYLFLLAAKIMNAMVKKEVTAGTVKGIQLPFGDSQQVIAQYANDTSMTLLGEEELVKRLILTLETFCSSSGLIIN